MGKSKAHSAGSDRTRFVFYNSDTKSEGQPTVSKEKSKWNPVCSEPVPQFVPPCRSISSMFYEDRGQWVKGFALPGGKGQGHGC
jgi:hypothetical protein